MDSMEIANGAAVLFTIVGSMISTALFFYRWREDEKRWASATEAEKILIRSRRNPRLITIIVGVLMLCIMGIWGLFKVTLNPTYTLMVLVLGFLVATISCAATFFIAYQIYKRNNPGDVRIPIMAIMSLGVISLIVALLAVAGNEWYGSGSDHEGGFTVATVVSSDYAGAFQSTEPSSPSKPSTDGTLQASSKDTHGFYTNYQIGDNLYSGNIKLEGMLPDGSGKMVYSNGNTYDGAWVDGVRTGLGTMNYYTGDTYVGEWYEGERHGKGTFTWKDGSRYTGNYIKGKRNDEHGEFIGHIFGNGWKGTYVGNIVEDKFEGNGLFTFEAGGTFVGEFRDNRHWEGTYTSEDGTKTEIKNGEPIP